MCGPAALDAGPQCKCNAFPTLDAFEPDVS